MTQKLSEQNLIEMISFANYQKLRNSIYQTLTQSDSFKNSKQPLCFAIQVFDLGEGERLHVEAVVRRADKGMHDLKITKCVLTDDLDFTFDRWNATKKTLGAPSEIIQEK